VCAYLGGFDRTPPPERKRDADEKGLRAGREGQRCRVMWSEAGGRGRSFRGGVAVRGVDGCFGLGGGGGKKSFKLEEELPFLVEGGGGGGWGGGGGGNRGENGGRWVCGW